VNLKKQVWDFLLSVGFQVFFPSGRINCGNRQVRSG
jgi:hypothetical protein